MQRPIVHRGLPFADYLRLDGINSSRLKYMDTSARLYRWRLAIPLPETAAKTIGRAYHTATLQPTLLATEVVTAPTDINRRTNVGKAQWADFMADSEGKAVLSASDYAKVLSMRDATLAHPLASEHLAAATETELTIQWTDPRTGLLLKARIDLLTDAAVVDLKSTKDLRPGKFSWQCVEFGYPFQIAMYEDGVGHAFDRDPDSTFKIIVQCSTDDLDTAVYDVPDEVIALGRSQYEAALDRLIECQESGVWPGVAWGEERTLYLPASAYPDEVDEPLTSGGQPIF